MVMARQLLKLQTTRNELGALTFSRREKFLPTAILVSILLLSAGCGETAKTVVSPAAGQVDTYFGGPFNVTGSPVALPGSVAFDHSASQIAVSSEVNTGTTQVPLSIIDGTFTSADTGFLAVTESLALNSSGFPSAQNPPVTGAWAVEIPGAGALANFLTLHATGIGP